MHTRFSKKIDLNKIIKYLFDKFALNENKNFDLAKRVTRLHIVTDRTKLRLRYSSGNNTKPTITFHAFINKVTETDVARNLYLIQVCRIDFIFYIYYDE